MLVSSEWPMPPPIQQQTDTSELYHTCLSNGHCPISPKIFEDSRLESRRRSSDGIGRCDQLYGTFVWVLLLKENPINGLK